MSQFPELFLFPQIAFAIGVLTSSLGAGDRGISGFADVIGCT